MDRTVVSSDRSLGAVMRFHVALEAQGMGADQFPPARPARPAAARSHRPSRAGASAFSTFGPPSGPDAAGRALAPRLQSAREWSFGDSSCSGTGNLMTRAIRSTYLLLLAGTAAVAAPAATSPLAKMGVGSNGSTLSLPMEIAISLTLLTLLPAAVMCITPFLRITVVLHFLRQALGTQSTPSNQVLLGLALFLTIVIMQPVAAEMYHQGWEPLEAGQVTTQQAMNDGSQPLKVFMVR